MHRVETLRAALAESRQGGDGRGVEWSGAEWEAVWQSLTDQQRRVLYLHVFHGLTLTAVAERLGLGRGAVDGAWRRALARIRAALPPP
jgi:DNA-directed RNA polymerase specialized sigma24 family protein